METRSKQRKAPAGESGPRTRSCGGWGARGQFLHAYSCFALFAPGPRRNIRNKLSVLDSLMRAQSLFAPMADRRPGSSYESDNVPFTRTTIGQELKALYQVPQDLPQGMLTLLMQLNAPHEEE